MLRIEDHFCGAGGSTTGAKLVADVQVVHAANHSRLAILTHSSNYPDVEHSCGDIPSMEPKRYPAADVLISTPECRARSYARGRPKDDLHLFAPGDGLDEKSRATMDEIPRWADARLDQGKPYKAIIVENVPQLVDWCEPVETGHWPNWNGKRWVECNCGETFRRWLKDMTNLGYEHQKVFLNSAFFPPTPQSRDRVYVVFWRNGQRKPNLDFNPLCWCNDCQQVVLGVQTVKAHLKMPAPVRKAWGPHDTVYGRYNQQYYYGCLECGARVVPAITPAITAIEPWHAAVKIGEREQHGLDPLSAGTMARIQKGLEGLPARPLVVPLDRLTDPDAKTCRAADINVINTITGQHRHGLVVQVAGNLGRLRADGTVVRAVENSHAHSTDRPLKTVHGSIDRGFVTAVGGPSGQGRNPQPLDGVMGTITTDNHRALIVSKNEFGNRIDDAQARPLRTVTTSGSGPRGGGSTSSWLLQTPGPMVLSNMEHGATRDSDSEPLATITTGNKLYAVDPWIVPLRRNLKAQPADAAELPTVCASGNHLYALGVTRMLVSNYGSPKSGPNRQGWARPADSNVVGTHTAKDTHALVEAPEQAIIAYRGEGQASRVENPLKTVATVEQQALAAVGLDIMECTFRMLEPSEIARGMVMHINANGDPYIIHGVRRDQVKQLGNAVTPPVMTALIGAIKQSLS